MNNTQDNSQENSLKCKAMRLHKLKTKNAVTRQETVKAEKEKTELRAEIKRANDQIATITKELERDEQLLKKGSRVIASAKCIHLVTDVDDESVGRLKNMEDWINTSSRRFETELIKYNKAFSTLHKIQTFPTIKSINIIISILNELVELKEESIKLEQEFIEFDLRKGESRKGELEKLKEKLIDQRMKDQKNKLQLDSFIRRFGGRYPYPSARDFTKGENAIQAAEAIVNKLKSKLNITSDGNQPQAKKNVLHFDFRGCK